MESAGCPIGSEGGFFLLHMKLKGLKGNVDPLFVKAELDLLGDLPLGRKKRSGFDIAEQAQIDRALREAVDKY